ncbi:DUF4173 domain-containing protein [Parabacteroides sp. FAFU027]|uniref:DUF4153 domain-containing protein n=1 Tax=Parabacteroides sp. FAFU027 TaxID=2922715 RepID=UPI001FB02EC9|nr:DUF4173 domain-containing protein [Parabacteroides sp. FAFU027]
MKNVKLFAGLLAGSSLYCLLMWYQELGINTLIFSVLLIGMIYLYKPEQRNLPIVKWLALAFFVSTVGVVINGNIFSKSIYYMSMLTFLSVTQSPKLRLWPSAGLSFLIHWGKGIVLDLRLLGDVIQTLFYKNKTKNLKNRIGNKLLRISIIGMLFIIFFLIFTSANQQFRHLCEGIFIPLNNFIELIFKTIKPFDIIHYLFVLLFLSLFFLRFQESTLSKWEVEQSDIQLRKKEKLVSDYMSMGLKEEYKTQWWSIVILNALLLVVNLTDVSTVWIGITPEDPGDLSHFVHTGTYSLIFSVLISVGVLLITFRGNLNFIRNNRQLKILSYIWIYQNGFLLMSVALRNIFYISEWGLTYKRIGVFMFLILTGIMLVYLAIKIKNRQSFFYFIRKSMWGIYAALILFGLFNWDLMIASYNHFHNQTDANYNKYQLSDQTLIYVPLNQRDNLDTNYRQRVTNRHWLSFNWFDYWAVKQLEKEKRN